MRYRIVRLQIQADPIKVGTAPLRRYDPAVIESVPRIQVSPSGVVGLADRLGSVLDVHHVDHPRTRDRKGIGGVTFMGVGDYARLRVRYGDHLTEGIAGETILLDAAAGFGRTPVPAEVTVLTSDGPIGLVRVRVADPCVEFSRFCLRQEPSSVVDADVTQALVDLADGCRGYRGVATGSGVIALGDQVVIADS